MTKRLTITVHTRERTVVRQLSAASLVHCEACAAEVVGVLPAGAAAVLQLSHGAISELIHRGLLHAIGDGDCLICSQSLFNLPVQGTQRDLGENI